MKDKIKESFKKNRDLYTLAGMVLALIIVFIVAYYIFGRAFSQTFDYKGMTFIKEKLGDIKLYHYSYFFDKGGQHYRYNLYLRGDPRENKVPVNGEITLYDDKFTYISINGTGLTECSNSQLAVAAISDFFASNLLKTRVAFPDKAEARAVNISFANCTSDPDRLVILIQKGDKTEITKEGSCHIISAANCEILEAIEKFEVQAILDAKNRAN